MISTITSSSELSGVRIGSEEIQRRWELVLGRMSFQRQSEFQRESVKLTVLIRSREGCRKTWRCLSLSTRSASAGPGSGMAVPDDAVRDG